MGWIGCGIRLRFEIYLALGAVGSSLAIWNEGQLAALLEGHASARVIGIDGLQGAGKSRIANWLGQTFAWPVIHADDFIRSPKRYPNLLDLTALGSAVAAKSVAPVLLDSILVRVVLEALGTPDAPTVYVRRRNADGSLASPDYYEKFNPALMLASAREEYLLVGTAPDEPMLECELITYHQRYDPVHRALAVFENVAGS
jgi:hypothetical protein